MKVAVIGVAICALGLGAGGASLIANGRNSTPEVPPCHACESRVSDPRPAPVVSSNAPVVVARTAPETAPSSDELALAQRQLADMSVLVGQLRADAAHQQARLLELEAESQKPKARGWTREGMEARMARMQKEEPERFKEMQQQRASFTERVQVAQLERTEFLDGLLTENMTEEQLAVHTELKGRLEELAGVTAAFAEGRFPSREERGALWKNMGAVRELYEVERDFVLQEIGRDLGMDDGESSEFSDYMGAVYEMTSMPHTSFRGSHGRTSSQGKQ